MTRSGVYALLDPRTWCVRYVGQTTNLNERLTSHLAEAKYNPRSRRPCLRWFTGLRKLGLRPILEPLEEAPVVALNTLECFWIAALRAAGAELLNVSDGGGKTGPHSQETRQKISAKAQGRTVSVETRTKLRVASTGTIKTPETLEKCRQAQQARIRTTEERTRISKLGVAWSKAHVGRTMSSETRAKLSAKAKGRPVSEQTKLKMSLQRKGKPQTAKRTAALQKMRASTKGRQLTAEHRRKIGEAQARHQASKRANKRPTNV